MSMATEKDFALKRSIYPYSLYVVVCTGIALLGLFDWAKTRDPGIFEASLLVTAFVAATLYGDTRYRIFWHDGEIEQISANKYVTTIPVSEITRIGQEKSDLRTRLSLRRPADRIAIYAEGAGETKHIDVSLRHFVAADIRRLMRVIHERRPELAVPKNWL